MNEEELRTELRRISDHITSKNAELPDLPVAVTEMTEREQEMFQNIIAPQTGLLMFLQSYLAKLAGN